MGDSGLIGVKLARLRTCKPTRLDKRDTILMRPIPMNDRHPYASGRDMLQSSLYALHVVAGKEDRRHQKEIKRDVERRWPETLNFIDNLNKLTQDGPKETK